MAIKLYKSQLTPTAESSNVANTNRISMSEVQSIGKAWKGMVQAGEQLYVTHQDIKTDNEILEKSKEVMNGGENFTGLSETTINASQMKDPDLAGKVYNDEWQKIFDNVNGTLSNGMAKKKFKAFMTKQNLKDINAIKTASTTNMINSLRTNKLDQIETLKKSIIYGTALESDLASKELSDLLANKKTKDIFGNTLDKVTKDTNKEIAYFGYKNVPISNQDAALAAAKKDKRLDAADVQKLITHFKTSKSTNNNLNKDNVSQMKSNLDAGIIFSEDEFNAAIAIATQNQDEKTLIKLKQMATDAPIIQDLNTKTVAQIEEKKNIFTSFKNREGGMTIAEANELRITEEYLASLTTSLEKDLITTAANKGVISISEINFEDILKPDGDMDVFIDGATNRIAQADTAASYYKRKVKYLTATEANTIKSVFNSADTAEQIIALSTSIVKGFGVKSDKVFQQISKDETILAHLGGLVIMNNGIPNENVKLAAKGLMISKNENLAKLYKMSPTDVKSTNIIKKYSEVFVNSNIALDSSVEMTNLIYAAQLKKEGKTVANFSSNSYQKAFIMAAGGTTVDGTIFDKKMGGFDENTRGTMVHIPPWLERGTFNKVIQLLKDNPELVAKASLNGGKPEDINGKEFTSIFTNEDPYFVTVDNGQYKIANGDNPVTGNSPEYILDSNKGFFVIDINKIKTEIINQLSLPNTTIEDSASWVFSLKQIQIYK